MSSILSSVSPTLVEVIPTYELLNRIGTAYFPHAINIIGVVLRPYLTALPDADLKYDDLHFFTYKEGDIEAFLTIDARDHTMIFLSTEPLFGYVEEVTGPFVDDEKQKAYEASQRIIRHIFRDWVNPCKRRIRYIYIYIYWGFSPTAST